MCMDGPRGYPTWNKPRVEDPKCPVEAGQRTQPVLLGEPYLSCLSRPREDPTRPVRVGLGETLPVLLEQSVSTPVHLW